MFYIFTSLKQRTFFLNVGYCDTFFEFMYALEGVKGEKVKKGTMEIMKMCSGEA